MEVLVGLYTLPYVDLDDNKAFLPHEEGVET
jgi:hypothetical protein